MFIFVACFIEP